MLCKKIACVFEKLELFFQILNGMNEAFQKCILYYILTLNFGYSRRGEGGCLPRLSTDLMGSVQIGLILQHLMKTA